MLRLPHPKLCGPLWQVTLRAPTGAAWSAAAKRAIDTITATGKIDTAAIEAARHG